MLGMYLFNPLNGNVFSSWETSSPFLPGPGIVHSLYISAPGDIPFHALVGSFGPIGILLVYSAVELLVLSSNITPF